MESTFPLSSNLPASMADRRVTLVCVGEALYTNLMTSPFSAISSLYTFSPSSTSLSSYFLTSVSDADTVVVALELFIDSLEADVAFCFGESVVVLFSCCAAVVPSLFLSNVVLFDAAEEDSFDKSSAAFVSSKTGERIFFNFLNLILNF